MTTLFLAAFYLVHIAIIPLLLIGAIRTVKARLANHAGPSILQPFWDIAKLLHKGETLSETSTWAFRLGPLISFGAILTIALMTPWLGVASPIAGDMFLFIYLLALGKFSATLASLDTGGPFGALGASREAAISLQSELAMIVGLASLAAHAHSSAFPIFLVGSDRSPYAVILAVLVAGVLGLAALAELSRMPIDDPATHLELTMVHEALLLENSGRNLAIVQFTAALKTAVLLGLVGQVLLMALPHRAPIASYLASLACISLAACTIALAETILVKLRWRRVPNLLSFAVGGAVLACLLVALQPPG